MWILWLLWFLWFLRVEYSANPLYKPLCAFLVFVDLVWFLCGSFCGFWSRVVFWSCASTCPQGLPAGLARRACPQGLRVHLPASMPMLARGLVVLWSCPRCRCLPVVLWFLVTCGSVVLRVHLPAGLARPIHLLWICGSVVLPALMRVLSLFVGRWSCPADACPWSCGLVVLPSMPMLARGLVVFGHVWICGLARPLARRSCASDPPPVDLWICGLARIDARPLALCGSVVLPCRCLPVVLWFCGLALDADACPQVFVVLWSCPRC